MRRRVSDATYLLGILSASIVMMADYFFGRIFGRRA